MEGLCQKEVDLILELYIGDSVINDFTGLELLSSVTMFTCAGLEIDVLDLSEYSCINTVILWDSTIGKVYLPKIPEGNDSLGMGLGSFTGDIYYYVTESDCFNWDSMLEGYQNDNDVTVYVIHADGTITEGIREDDTTTDDTTTSPETGDTANIMLRTQLRSFVKFNNECME